MKVSATLVILNITKIGERSIVLHTLSAEYGRRSFICNVSKGTGMALFLPLNIVEAEIQESPRTDLWRAGNIVAKYPLDGIRGNIYKNTMTLFMSEVLYRAVRDGANEDGLAEWCIRSILTLDAMESDFSNFHIRFLLEFASALGFRPTSDDLAPFVGQYLQTVGEFLEKDFASSMLIPLSGAARSELASLLMKYISYHTDSNIEIRSLKVLHEIL